MSDVFISYSSNDREWARRTDQALRRRMPGATTFLDYDALRAGDDWETRIDSAIQASRHLVVLWSDFAKERQWVQREVFSFMAYANVSTDPGRRLVCVNLQGRNDATKRFQQIEPSGLQSAYPNIGSVTANDWDDLAREIEAGIDPDRKPLIVPLVVLSVTQQQLRELSADRRGWLSSDYQIADDILHARYGPSCDDWLPFADTKRVAAILDQVRNDVNDSFENHRVEWKLPSRSFWADIDAAETFVDDEFSTAQLSVLIIDPVGIYHPDVFQRLMLFQESFADNRTVILTLPPFGAHPDLVRLREALIKRGKPYFNDYFRPVVPPRRRLAAQCGWHVSDADDVARHILAAAANLGEEQPRAKRSAFVSHGPRR